ncbi:hypothetical protein Aasi_0591 [Candidatus Amoebophilus asiaticus 5a2]|uniref:Uncharacterized protein n=1 Tax=Amoebophilus asiaticus (strain 5a2) TaxID=452471 RepID=B3ERZ0_AMOA5|nr:hypothetical protein [Candidatus Amoebophilus asiaticus]ACE05992.1 hypothetical protein Aasi_0591 [Candidatus Amoebophilus asiaticus 5a2]
MHEKLQKIKGKVATGSLQLDADGLGSAPLAKQLKQAFGNTLKLKIKDNSLQEGADYIQFQATADSLLGIYYQNINIVFYIYQEDIACLIAAVLPKIWNFSWAYPDLPPYTPMMPEAKTTASFFNRLSFVEPIQALFSSHDFPEGHTPHGKLKLVNVNPDLYENKRIYSGINYLCILDLYSLPLLSANLLQFMNISGSLSTYFYGHVEQQEEDHAQLQLIADLSLEKELDIFKFAINQLKLYTSTSVYDIRPFSGVSLLGEISIEDQQSQSMELVWPIGSTSLMFQNDQSIPFPGFATFKEYFPKDYARFPIELKGDELAIHELKLTLSLISPAISHIFLSIGTHENWKRLSLIQDIISIENLDLQWDITPGNNKNTQFYILSDFNVGGGIVEVSAGLPDFVFYGDLGLYQTVNFSQLFTHFFPQAHLPEVEVLDLSVEADIQQKTYNFEIEIADGWELALQGAKGAKPLPLKNMSMQLEHDSYSTFATITSVLYIAEVPIKLVAMKDSQESNKGWEFTGSTGLYQEISINKLLKYMAKQFGLSDSDFPQVLEGLTFSNLELYFETLVQAFRFTGEAQFEIEEDNAIDITVQIDLKKNELGAYEKTFSGFLTIGDLVFDIEFSKNLQDSILIATHSYLEVQKIHIQKLVEKVSPSVAKVLSISEYPMETKDIILGVDRSTTHTSHRSESATSSDSPTTFFFGLDVVGKSSPTGQNVQADKNIPVFITSQEIESTQAQKFNQLIKQRQLNLPKNGIPQGIMPMLEDSKGREPANQPAP